VKRDKILQNPPYPEEFPQGRVVWFARLPLHILQILCKPESQHLQRAIELIAGVANGYERVRLIEVVPVLEVGRRLEELGW